MARRINTPFLLIVLGTIAVAVVVIGGLVYVKTKNDPLRHIRRGDAFLAQGEYEDAHAAYLRAIGKDAFTPAYYDKAIGALQLIVPETQDDANNRYGTLMGLLFKKAEIVPDDEAFEILRRAIEANRVVLEGIERERGAQIVSRFEMIGSELETYEDLPADDAGRAWVQNHILEHEWRFATLMTEIEWEESRKRLDAMVALDPTNQYNQYALLRARLDRAISDMAGARRRAGERELAKIQAALAEVRTQAGEAPEFNLIEFEVAHRQYLSGRSAERPNLELAATIAELAQDVSERQRLVELVARLKLVAREQVLHNDRDYTLDSLTALVQGQASIIDHLYELDSDDWRNTLLYMSTRGTEDIPEAEQLARVLATIEMPTVGGNSRRYDITRLQAAAYIFRARYTETSRLQAELREVLADQSVDAEARAAAQGKVDLVLASLDEAYAGLMTMIEEGSAANPALQLQIDLDHAYAHEAWETAMEHVNKLLATGARLDSSKMLVAADVAMRAGDHGSAARFVEDVMAVRPDLREDPGFHLIRARLAFQTGQFGKAVAILSRLIAELETSADQQPRLLSDARELLRSAERRNRPPSVKDDPLFQTYADALRARASGDIDRQRAVYATALASYDAQTPGSDQARVEHDRAVNRLITSLAILELTELDGDAETAKAHAARLLSIDPENTVGRLITEMAGKGRVEGLLAIATMAEPDDEQKRWERFWIALRNEKLGLEQSIVGAKADPGITTVAEFARLEDDLAQVSAELTTVEARILASESKSSLVLRYLVSVAIGERDFPAAEAALADLVARDGESWRTAISRARLHSVQGDAKTAADVLAKAIEDGRTNSIVMRQYGRTLLELGQIEDGTNALSTAYQNSPGDAATALDYATALYRAGDSAESLQVLRRASNVGRSNPTFRARWLALEEQMGSSSLALAERLRVWEMNPADWRNGTSYGRLLVTADADWRDMRDPNTGRQLLNAAQWSRLPRTEKAKYVDAVRRERMAQSEVVFTELTARPNASPVIFTSFADTLEMRGERDRGVDMLRATIDDPDQTLGATERALLAIDLANRYFDVANRDEAKAWIKRAREEQPEGDPVADRMLVRLWQSKSEPARLADALRQVLALDQSDGFEDRRIPNTRLLVRSLLDAGGIEEAGKIFDEQLADSTMTPDLLIGGALRLEQARRAQIRGEGAQADTALESARNTFEQAALADSGAIEPSLQLARLFELRYQWFSQSEDIQTAIEHARSAMRRYQSSWIAQELLCLLLIRAEDLGTASGALEAYVEQNPSNDNARLMLVRMYESTGKAERAVELCQAAVDRNPFSIPWNVRLGKLRGDQGRYTEAAIAFKRLFDITHDPAVARFFVEMRLLRDPPDYEGVLAFARANVSMFRNDPFLAGAYAATLAHGGRAQNAFNELETAYKRFRASGAPASSMQQLVTWLPRIVEVTNPEAQVAEQSEQLMDTFSNGDLDMGTRIVLANAWIASGPDGQSKAIEHLRVVLAREDAARKLGATPYLTMGSLLYESGDCEGSLDMFERALALAPNSALLMNNVAFARAQCDSDLERAVAEAIEASRLEPLNSSVLDTLGYILIKQGKLEAADAALRRSLARRRAVPALLHLAEVRILSNQLDDAQTLLKEAGDSSPTPQQQSELTALVARLAAAKEAP